MPWWGLVKSLPIAFGGIRQMSATLHRLIKVLRPEVGFVHVDKETDACILMHTWEMDLPPGMVRTFRAQLGEGPPSSSFPLRAVGKNFWMATWIGSVPLRKQ
ncbi:MAG: hypothetical protein ACI81P_001742 [Neolewinella sp.]|jgi:hypothetical protein